MTSFVLTSDELKSAPPAVRQWLLGRIEAELMALAAVPAPAAHAPALAACTPDEAAQIFEMIRGDFASTQVFLELAREPSLGESAGPLHAVSIANMMRHTRLGDGALISCLQTINQAFRQIRADPEAVLFGFDQANHVYVHEATHRSIHGLWQELVRLHTPETASAQEPFTFPPIGFAPRHMGPSEDVAAHREP